MFWKLKILNKRGALEYIKKEYQGKNWRSLYLKQKYFLFEQWMEKCLIEW